MSTSSSSLEYKKVAIGMPVYNGEEYLEESIRSNLAQSFGDFYLIIADNASTDRTEEICRDYAAKDNRIHYIRNKQNLGASKNYSRCFNPANCTYFRWANADDLAEPTLVEKCVEILDEHADCVLAYGKTNIIDSNGKLIEKYDDKLHLQQALAKERFIHFITSVGLSNILYGLIRRDSLARTSLFGNYQASDVNLIGELSLYGKFFEVPEYLFSRRMHPEASSWDRKDSERQRNFWDPSKRKLVLQTWRSAYEYYRAVTRAPISAGEKISLFAYLTKHAYWHKSAMYTEMKDFVKYGLLKKS